MNLHVVLKRKYKITSFTKCISLPDMGDDKKVYSNLVKHLAAIRGRLLYGTGCRFELEEESLYTALQ